jgi:acyl-coenzyme A synthetase/AMP-(fatty) acid ligase
LATFDRLLDALARGLDSRAFAITSVADGQLGGERVAACIHRAARQLAAEKVMPGDAVLYQGPQGVEAFALFWASMARGAVFAPLDREWPDYLVRRAASGLSPRLTVSSPERAALYKALYPQARHVSLAPDCRTGESEWDRWLAEADGATQHPPPAPIDERAAAAYLFTSGSTGVPKAVVLSRSALVQGGRLTVESFSWRAGEILVNAPEPHTMSGLRNGFVAAPLAGVRLHVPAQSARANVFALLEALGEARCERFVTSPVFIRQLAMLGERVEPEALKDLKAIYCTGAALNWSDVEAVHARFRIPVVNYYGLTETGGICISQRVASWRPDDRSIGVAAGAELRVVDDDGQASGAGVGELQVRSPQLMSEYLGDPERTAARLADGWLRTGDRVRIDPDGRCFLLGRIDGFLKSASTDRIAPEEIEAVLEEHPSVAEAAVLGLRDEQDVERIVALVATRPETEDLSILELASYVRERLGPARTPTQIQFVERLPRQGSGKIIRTELRRLLRDT